MPPKNFHDQIVDTLGYKIVSGEYASGMRIPPEPVLAETFSVSRLAIREAMKTLAAKGLVSIRPKTGTHVLPREAWNLFDPNVLAWYTVGELDGRFINDLMELRRAIEPCAAKLAAVRASHQDIQEMRDAFAAMKGAATQAEYIAADVRFHSVVLAASNNQFIRQLQAALSEVLKTSFHASSSEAWGKDAAALELHRMLLLALERRDVEGAAQAVENLIQRAEKNIFQRYTPLTGDQPTGKGRAPRHKAS